MKWGIYNGYGEEFWCKDSKTGELESFDTEEEALKEAISWREGNGKGKLDEHESMVKQLPEGVLTKDDEYKFYGNLYDDQGNLRCGTGGKLL